MDVNTYLKKQIKSMWYLQDSVVKDLTDEQLMLLPPGTVSPIGVIWLHMVNSEDNFVSTIQEQESLWDSGGWDGRFSVGTVPDMGEDWTKYQDADLTVELLQAYTEAVREKTKACLKVTKGETLDETVKFFSDSDPKASVWVLLIGHTLIHSGEIAAIKGVLGNKGLPF